VEEQIEGILNNMLGAAFQQGMAAQRVADAQADFDEQFEIVGSNIIKLRELLNIGPEKEKVQ
jgi:hypothetical protein